MLECYFIDLLLNFFTNTPSVQFFLSSINNNNNNNNNMAYTLVSGKKYFQSKVLHIINIFIYKQ